MKTVNKKTKVKRRAKKQPAAKGAKKIDREAVREKVASMVASEVEDMVNAAIGEGNKGHFQAMKYLFEVAGIFPAGQTPEGDERETSFSELLCKQLELAERQSTEGQVTEVSERAATGNAHSIE